MDCSTQELPNDLKSILTYTVEVFSFLLLRNERISLSEFARRISQVTSPCKRTLLGIHSLLAVEGDLERRYNGISLQGLRLLTNPSDFPCYSGWSKWTEERIRAWLKERHCRLDEAGIVYPMAFS